MAGRKYGYCNPKLKAKLSPSIIDIAWAAGIFEGEGHCRQMSRYSQYAAVTQKDTWILYKLRDLFGGRQSIPSKRDGVSYWQITGARARGFLMTIYKFLSPRRKLQVRKALLIND